MRGAYVLVGNEIKDYETGGFLRIDDLGFTRGIAVCTAIESKGGIFFNPEKHKERLKLSAAMARIPLRNAVGWRHLFGNLARLDTRCRLKESLIYVYITRGRGYRNWKPYGRPQIYAFVLSGNRRTAPMKVFATNAHHRNTPAIKTTNYLSGHVAWTDLGEPDDVLYVDSATNEVLESATKNIFVVRRDSQLQTPPAQGKILNGVTRQIILSIAREEKGFKELAGQPIFPCVEETSINFNEMIADAKRGLVTGVVLASTTTVAPVQSINGVQIQISQKTKDFCEQFLRYREAYYAKYR